MSTAEQERTWWDDRGSTLHAARAAIWDETVPNEERVARMVDQIVPALRPVLHKDARVLDLGCGVGDVTRALARRYPSVKFVGVDISSVMLKLARVQPKFQGNVRFMQGDGRGLPILRMGRLEGAFSVLMFQHIPAEAQATYIREVAYWLESGGIFRFQFVTCPDAAFLSNGATEEQVREWCEEAGLKVDTIDHGAMCETWAWCTAVKS